MSIIKSGMALFGLVACVLNSLSAATAAPFDKYLVAPIGTTSDPGAYSPFQVKASDYDAAEYLRFYYYNYDPNPKPDLPRVGLSPDISSLPRIGIGEFFSYSYPQTLTEIIWVPYIASNDTAYDPYVLVHLTLEDGVDKYGDIKLEATTRPYCNMLSQCYPTQKVFTASRGQPQRMATLNGDQIEVVPVIIRLDDTPWATYYFGYDVGLVAADVFSPRLAVQSFSPVSLPPPKVEGTVVEYVNTEDFPNAPGGHFFYTADPAEQAAVDAGSAGNFVRTGRSFASGGFVPVCRFYGSMSPGPNSHFFTVSDTECETLKSMQVNPTPATSQQWNYEGAGMYSVAPVVNAQGQQQCMSGTVPVFRAYNNAYPKSGGKNPWDSNHRFSTQNADIDAMVATGWVAEGIALCAPTPSP